MITSLDATSTAFLDSLNKIGGRMQKAQRELATGLRFSTVSDDPDQVSAVLQTRADLNSASMIQDNLGRVKGEVDGAEQALSNAVSILERVRTLSSQGATGTSTAESRQAIAQELGSLLEQLGGISRTTIEGRYIFSGDNDQVAPYTIDLAQANTISVYAGSTATREVQHPNGTRFSVAHTAQEIFDSATPGENVFYAVDTMRKALLANDQTSINSALQDVISSQTHLNGELSYYGAVQNKVADAVTFGENLKTQLTSHLGTLQDADITEAILELQQASTQQQAALTARAQMPRTSLFDYLG